MAEKIEDGGPAFPSIDGPPSEYLKGMSLRDYFAGQTLLSCGSFWSDAETRRTFAKRAYQMADALLKARKGDA
jgi:hypothetical protein